jgi:hypothetical protein
MKPVLGANQPIATDEHGLNTEEEKRTGESRETEKKLVLCFLCSLLCFIPC